MNPRCEFMYRLRVWPYASRCSRPSTHEILPDPEKHGERILVCDEHANEARWHITSSKIEIKPL